MVEHADMASGGGLKQSVFRVRGLDCVDCASALEATLSRLGGIARASVSFGTATISVEHTIPEESIITAVRKAGYRASPRNAADHDWRGTWPRLFTTVLSGILLIAAWTMGRLLPADALTVLYLAAILVGGLWTFRRALASARVRLLDMNVLMTIAVIGAGFIGEWSEGALIAFLFSMSNLLESFTLERTRRSIRSLMEMAPREATVRRNGILERLPVDQVAVGETVIVRPGERISLDGTVLRGYTSVDESPITGESAPPDKHAGDEVFAGTLNGQGAMEIMVTRRTEDTLFSRIMERVEEAQSRRAPSQAFVDRFASVYTPMVLGLVVLTALIPPILLGLPWETWFYRSLALLLVACPCALVISTPVAIVSAIGTATRQGVLVKGGAVLEQIGSISAVAFDKTGTLTRGQLKVISAIPAGGFDAVELIGTAAAIEQFSEHPIAMAVVQRARELGVETPRAESFRALPGRGASAIIQGKTVYIGTAALFTSLGIELDGFRETVKDLEETGVTTLLAGGDEGIIGLIAVADEARAGSARCIAELRESGVERIVMLSGDNQAVSRSVGALIGIDEIRAGLLPQDKVAAIRDLLDEREVVAMVGEGINDAPALAAATVGIAMGVTGTDTALETADIALMSDDLSKIPWLVRLSRRTLRIIKQNIAFAIIIKVIAVCLIFPGWLTLWMAVMSDMGASILVTMNGMRLLKERVS